MIGSLSADINVLFIMSLVEDPLSASAKLVFGMNEETIKTRLVATKSPRGEKETFVLHARHAARVLAEYRLPVVSYRKRTSLSMEVWPPTTHTHTLNLPPLQFSFNRAH